MWFVNISVHKKFTLKRDLRDGGSEPAFQHCAVKDTGVDWTQPRPSGVMEADRKTPRHGNKVSQTAPCLGKWGRLHRVLGCGGGWWQKDGHGCSERRGPWMNPLMSQGHPLELRGAQNPLRLCRDLRSALGCQRTTH